MLLLSKFYNIRKGKSIMLLISQNIESYNIKLPENTVFRIRNQNWMQLELERVKLIQQSILLKISDIFLWNVFNT
ncbi:uncharacterized protein METZ01_LOCUS231491 [marine metagenome]|uniref:Uncharacterized protein n=1 Tax=marine metagenome TaxID=408172 RepID=A0A382GVB6_9ZZZZ